MATIGVDRLTVQPFAGGSPSMWRLPEAASQTFLEGALLKFATTGIAEAASNAAALDLAGVALAAGQNAVVYVAQSSFAPLFPGSAVEASMATAAGTVVAANTHYGALVGFVKRSTGVLHWVVDPAQTQKHGRIVGITGDMTKGVIGDTNIRVLVALFNADIASLLRTLGWA
jgi:hypothetical protein